MLYWHYPLNKPHFLGGRSSGAIRQNNYKLIEFFDDGHVELYNLADDIGEKHNLSEKLSEKVAELQNRLSAWRSKVGAEACPPPLGDALRRYLTLGRRVAGRAM